MSTNIGPDTDAELKTMVRALTQYDDNELPPSDLDTQVEIAKLRIKNATELDVTKTDPFYGDDGITQALLYATAIYTKGAVENIALDRWSVGDVNIESWETGDANSQQFQHWAELVAEGMRASDVDTTGPLPNVTYSFP